MKHDFKVGDVVRLNAKGISRTPWMTVERIAGQIIHCVWFDTNDHLQQNYFLCTLLEKRFET